MVSTAAIDFPALQAIFGRVRLHATLRRRFETCLAAFAAAPMSSLPSLFARSDYVACVRMLNNPRMHEAALFDAIVADSVARARSEACVLALHDTTEFRFPGAVRRAGLGRLNTNDQGFLGHVALGVCADATRGVLGLLHLETVVRGEAHANALPRAVRKARAVHEGQRWGRGVAAVRAALGDTACVHVMDREGDVYEGLVGLVARGARFVVRQRQPRRVTADGVLPSPRVACPTTRAALADAPVLYTTEVALQARAAPTQPTKRKRAPGRAARRAHLEVRAAAIHLARPHEDDPALPVSLPVNVIDVRERDAPADAEPIDWVLLTTEPIDDATAVQRVVAWYRARWLVEEFFKAIKTGCAYEARQSESLVALRVLLAMYIPIATALLDLRTRAQHAPSTPAAEVTDDVTLAVLAAAPRACLPASPTVAQLLLAIAALGGHHPNNGPPGWLTLLRGMVTLNQMKLGFAASKARDGPRAT